MYNVTHLTIGAPSKSVNGKNIYLHYKIVYFGVQVSLANLDEEWEAIQHLEQFIFSCDCTNMQRISPIM